MADYRKIVISVAKRFEPELMAARRAIGSAVGVLAVQKVKDFLEARGVDYKEHSNESEVGPDRAYSKH